MVKNDWKGLKGNYQGFVLSSNFIRDKISPLIFGGKQNNKIKELMRNNLNSEGTFIDFGAGTGYYSFLALNMNKNISVKAVELSDTMLNIFEKKIRSKNLSDKINILKEDVTNTSLPSNIADLAIAANLFHELKYPEQLAKEIFRTLKKEGIVIITEFLDTLLGKIITSHHNKTVHGPYSKKKLQDIFSQAGFSDINVLESRGRILLYAKK